MIPLLNEIEVAKQLCLTTQTLRKWRWLGKGPNFIKIGSSVRYEQEEIATFIEDNIKNSTSELTTVLSSVSVCSLSIGKCSCIVFFKS